ncbi:3-phosphoserine/phosphohydroxythreonine transaminase [Erysipelothrix anatis]|uniref:3-phosphoserine/phosphohydroxythreonine transaminase n=1 Tax=Erysipelothrix anatis TaxID=2683713 RepID=UPI00140D2A77|nr:3-phosphoserine/phosphohydroxythreonine transaminase [Erysipelothrix anatis]
MRPVYNFSAGPAMLPESVLLKIQDELLSYQGSNVSMLEVNHRSSEFFGIIDHAKATLKELMNIPDTYSIVFLQGGTSQQFAMIPMNFAKGRRVAYVDTGFWSAKAIEEALILNDTLVVGSSKEDGYSYLPMDLNVPEDCAYVHITTNATSEGLMYRNLPDTNGVPLIGDACSNILGFPYDINDFAMLYAGTQKNLGMSGLTLAIIRNDMLHDVEGLPYIFDYKKHIQENSVYNTSPTFAIYVTDLMLTWVKEQGGVEALSQQNERKAAMLYELIDRSGFYSNWVKPSDRSSMNVVFTTNDETLDTLFVEEAALEGMINLGAHRSSRGMRVSIYNAMPVEAVEKLVDFMNRFQEKYQ